VGVLLLLPVVFATLVAPNLGVHVRPDFVRVAASGSVSLSVSDSLRFTPSSVMVTPGASIKVLISNLGSLAHTFTLSSVANYTIPSSDTPADLSAFFSKNAPLANVSIGAGVGTTATVTFTAPKTGFYEFVCTVPGHFQSGMLGFLGSGVTPPGATVSTGPGAPVFIIAGTIVTLIIIAIVLGFVIGKREGSKYEMPPERLGYPEPSPPPPDSAGGNGH
jgi:uncharacterized cupredoxin-like copper-binding protein